MSKISHRKRITIRAMSYLGNRRRTIALAAKLNQKACELQDKAGKLTNEAFKIGRQLNDVFAILDLGHSEMNGAKLNPALVPFLQKAGRARARKLKLHQSQGEALALCEYLADGLRRLKAGN